jgi:hypothetical protein
MTTVQLTNLDARLAYLALQYHLARPGSELDPMTKQSAPHGLSEVAAALDPQLDRASAAIELNDEQRQRMLSALSGAINELKATSLLAGGGKSMVPAFRETLHRLFPDAAEDEEEATRLAGHMLMLRRRLEQIDTSVRAQPEHNGKRSRWHFWKRKGA